MTLDSVAVILMTKFPEPGKVKTRLQPALSLSQAAKVHETFLLHMAARLDRLQPEELIVCYDPPEARIQMRNLLHTVCSASFIPQKSGDLGARMAAAARQVGAHYPRMLFIGVDSPDVPAAYLLDAARLTGETSVSLGPAKDGGYWCLGLSNQVDAESLLSDIHWSTGREARQTLERADALNYSTATAGQWDDIDRPDDLHRLMRRLSESSNAENLQLLNQLRDIVPFPFIPDGACP